MNQRWRSFAISVILVILSAAGARALSRIRFFELLNLKAYDAQFVLRGKRPTPDIVLVVADQKALDTFPELRIFWHRYYAEAIRAASDARARAIGLDVAFGVPVTQWEPALDGELVDAVQSSHIPVICGYIPAFNTNQATVPVPINMVTAALGLAGYSNLTVDPDDFVRRQELFESGDNPAHSFALRIAEKASDFDVRRAPIAPDHKILINYAGPPDTFPRYSLADVVAAARTGRKDELRNWLTSKIVLIGADTVDDRYATPFYTFFHGLHYLTAGVEIHANTVATLLNGDYLRPVSESARDAALLLAAAATIGIVMLSTARTVVLWVLLESLGIVAITQGIFRAGWILSVSEVLEACAIGLVLAVVVRFSNAEQRGNLFRRAISLFVGKRLAESLDKSQTIRLSGSRQDVTILFTDIRGFTAFTERVSREQGPEVVVQMLNQYLSVMVAIILRHHGHVNKFIGDGILAVFSDEDPGARPGDHPARAVRCALEMVSAPSQFETGAGIHTGVAVVGNVGSDEKMEYTVLGDTVNLASRLESLNKENKTKLLMSEETEKRLSGAVETRLLGSIAVRGKSAPVNLYTVTALDA